jgi:tRNA(fMet)-specific endonuclease VapC
MKKVLLDTNAYSALMTGDAQILQTLESTHQVLISPICVGELLAGFKLGTKEKVNRNILSEFLKQPTVELAPITAETSEWFAKIFADLKQNGTPIPLNDVWIAAQAMEHGAKLLTLDKHFQVVPGLLLLSQG